ncbi:MalY/PatB family protein [Actibacterium ureilyticum]|uniref:MalY/PatB family protein n=1 Tax=Actibacterium ureilyticum TaxID=1590614 RepID=UPI000BAAA8E9|nr:PatB family C-S lyase [Actibacterium ureilyticum]
MPATPVYDFDAPVDRRGTDSSKWDMMERAFGVSPDDGLAMWVADMDFPAPDFLQDAVKGLLAKANYGYFAGYETFLDAVQWWMQTRHGWTIDTDWVFTTFGLGNGLAMAIQTFSAPGDHVAILTPVYHEFAAKIGRTGRVVTELPMGTEDGVFVLDFDRFDRLMTGREKMLLLSAPHNPAGRIWTQAELSDLAAFCARHDLILVSDEIHCDLILTGHKHLPMHLAAPQIADRLIMMSSASKTFNIAGSRTGCVTIPDADLRARFGTFHRSLDISPNLLGVTLTRAAYSQAGADWVDQLMPYIAGNAQLFNDGVNAIPGLSAMPMQSTYLAWVDFAGTGMNRDEIHDRVYRQARIAATPGHTLGTGGETCMRFNLGTQRARVAEAVARLQEAFSDLQ